MLSAKNNTRRFTRVATDQSVRLYDGSGAASQGRLCDVGYGGLRLSLGRYIKPQTLVRVPVSLDEQQLSFPAHVVWCAPEGDSLNFRLGLKADHAGKYTMAILSSWVLDAVQADLEACACGASAT